MKLHYGIPSACGLENPARTTNVKDDVDCLSCRRTQMFNYRLVARLTDDEMNDLAMRVVRQEVYLTNTPDGLKNSFGWIFSLMSPAPSQEFLESIGACWAPYSEALPRALNGYPLFMQVHMVHVDDVEPLIDKIEAKQEALAVA